MWKINKDNVYAIRIPTHKMNTLQLLIKYLIFYNCNENSEFVEVVAGFSDAFFTLNYISIFSLSLFLPDREFLY